MTAPTHNPYVTFDAPRDTDILLNFVEDIFNGVESLDPETLDASDTFRQKVACDLLECFETQSQPSRKLYQAVDVLLLQTRQRQPELYQEAAPIMLNFFELLEAKSGMDTGQTRGALQTARNAVLGALALTGLGSGTAQTGPAQAQPAQPGHHLQVQSHQDPFAPVFAMREPAVILNDWAQVTPEGPELDMDLVNLIGQLELRPMTSAPASGSDEVRSVEELIPVHSANFLSAVTLESFQTQVKEWSFTRDQLSVTFRDVLPEEFRTPGNTVLVRVNGPDDVEALYDPVTGVVTGDGGAEVTYRLTELSDEYREALGGLSMEDFHTLWINRVNT